MGSEYELDFKFLPILNYVVILFMVVIELTTEWAT
jgi:hypothetical protein